MEQPNMMPNMNNTMQRPQSGNVQQQMHAQITEKLRRKAHSLPQGWQSTFDIGQRANRIMQMVSGLRMLHQEVNKCVLTAEGFEERTILESPSKDIYYDSMQRKLAEIMQKRQQAAQQLQNGQFNMSMNTNMNNNGMGMAQNGMSGMNGFQNGGMSGMNMDMGFGMNMQNGGNMGMSGGQMGGMTGLPNQNFPAQLQRPMQASPLSLQQQQQPNGTMDPSALQTPQMPPQMSNMGQSTPQPPQQPQQMNTNQDGQARPGDPTTAEIMAAARRLYAAMPDDQKNSLRPKFLNSLSEQQRQSILSQGGDPLLRWMASRAREMILKNRAGQTGQQPGGMQNANNMGMSNNNIPQTPQSGAPNFNFSNMVGQQANAIKSQESGGEVVPASNNNGMNMGGQMNMSQGVNPQMIGNQGNQNSQAASNQQLQMQFMAMQQEKQRRDLMMKAQQQARALHQNAQQQNANAQNQLRGQPGGLATPNNLNGGQTQSPASNMTMLTQPMAPPGQTSTPTMPQTPMNNPASQLAQHHQNMLNQNNQQMSQGGGFTMAQRQQLLNGIPPAARERLAQMAPHQVNEVLQRLSDSKMGSQAQNQQGQQNQQGSGSMAPNPGMGGAQGQNAQSMMPTNFGNMQNVGQHPNPQNQQQSQAQSDQSAQFQQRLQQHQANQLRQRALDMRPFPKQVTASLGMSVPDHVNEWGKLKQHISQNQAVLPPNSLQKLNNLQGQWFGAHPEEVKQAIQELQQRMQAAQQSGSQQPQQQPQQPPRPPSSMAMPNGQAPPAPMVPPTPTQQPLNQTVGGPNAGQQQMSFPPSVQTPTPQEIQVFRQRVPASQTLSDDQIRQLIIRRRGQPNAQQQQQMRNQPPQAQGFPNAGQQGHVAQANQHQQHQQNRPPQPQQALSQQNNQAQGQKRPQPSNDDVLEIANPNARSQASSLQTGQSQHQQQGTSNAPRLPTREEIERLPPEKRMMFLQQMRQMEALRKAQMGVTSNQATAPSSIPTAPSQPYTQQQTTQPQPVGGALTAASSNLERAETLKRWLHEVARATPKGQAVQLDSKGIEQAQMSLKKLWPMVHTLEKSFGIIGRAQGFDEARVKQALRARMIVLQNVSDGNGTIRDYLSVTPADLQKLEAFLNQYYGDLKTLKERQQQHLAGQGPPVLTNALPQQPQPEAPKQQVPQQPRTAAARKASQQTHARKPSAGSKAPPAPTENKTFDWGSPSPHGVPKYETAPRNELTADKLKFPPPKKRKTGPQGENQASPSATTPQSTSTGAVSSPITTGAKSSAQQQAKMVALAQQQRQQQQQQMQSQAKAKHQCDDLMCEASVGGFETEAELKQHKDTVHQPVSDPMKFLLDSAAQALGLDSNGNPIPAQKDVKMPGQARVNPKAAFAAKSSSKRDTQTPTVKQESATPGAKAGTTPAGKKTDSKIPDPSTKTDDKEKTLMEVMAEKVGFDLPAKETKPTPEISIESAEDIWIDGFQGAFGNTDHFLDDWNDFVRHDDWSLRPGPESSPELTPSDQASQSSRESDISQSEKLRINFSWDPFGNGDTTIPEVLMIKDLGLGDAGTNEGQDDTNAEKIDDKMKDQWDWSNDLINWDSTFGANAGLDDSNGVSF